MIRGNSLEEVPFVDGWFLVVIILVNLKSIKRVIVTGATVDGSALHGQVDFRSALRGVPSNSPRVSFIKKYTFFFWKNNFRKNLRKWKMFKSRTKEEENFVKIVKNVISDLRTKMHRHAPTHPPYTHVLAYSRTPEKIG